MGYEIPQAVALHDKPFSVDSGVLTATFKLVRNAAKQVYADDIVAMYKDLGEEVKL